MKPGLSKINLVLGSHAHVPYGASPCEFEAAYENRLRPFITALYRHPKIQAVFHYSGVLLNWVERTHQEIFSLIADMVERKQVEMLGGGFYEPILTMIPPKDRTGQIELLTTYIRRQFKKRPQGFWLPEYSWEQGMVSPLVSCGMAFTFLDEKQFALAGATADAPCLCEDQGKLITVFPVSTSLGEAFAGKSVPALLEDLAQKYECLSGAVFSVFPDRVPCGSGEPLDNAWGRFFEELSLCGDFAETVSPGKLCKRLGSLKKLYIPASVGDASAVSARGFVISSPEAGRLYSKMLFTSVLVDQVKGDKSRKQYAFEELWKAQGSALFCRKGSGGIHCGAIRNEAYSALIRAEQMGRDTGRFSPSLQAFDFDIDGADEWLFCDTKLNCMVRPKGGGVFEIDYLPKAWNYADTCLDRTVFCERLLPAGTVAESLETGAVKGARLCTQERYEPAEVEKQRRRLRLALARTSGPFGGVEIEKTFTLKKDTLCVKYSLANRCGQPESFCLAPEIDIAVPGETEAFVRFYACRGSEADTAFVGTAFPDGKTAASGTAAGVDGIKIHDLKNEAQIALGASCRFDAKIVPVYLQDTVSGKKLFQAFCIMPLLPVNLEPGKTWEVEFSLRFSD